MDLTIRCDSTEVLHHVFNQIDDDKKDIFFVDDQIGLLAVRSNGHHYVGSLGHVMTSKKYQYFSKEIKQRIQDEIELVFS